MNGLGSHRLNVCLSGVLTAIEEALACIRGRGNEPMGRLNGAVICVALPWHRIQVMRYIFSMSLEGYAAYSYSYNYCLV